MASSFFGRRQLTLLFLEKNPGFPFEPSTFRGSHLPFLLFFLVGWEEAQLTPSEFSTPAQGTFQSRQSD